jgi:hypothetical protein
MTCNIWGSSAAPPIGARAAGDRPAEVIHRLGWPQSSIRLRFFVNPEEMRAKALEFDEKVRGTRDPGLARMYSELGRQWRELADQVEKQS